MNEENSLNNASNENEGNNTSYIYGTEIEIQEMVQIFTEYVSEYIAVHHHTDEESYVKDLLAKTNSCGDDFIVLDAETLMLHSENTVRFYRYLVSYPQELIPIVEMIVTEEYKKLFPNDAKHISVRFFNLRTKCGMRDISPDQVDSLISIAGMVIRCNDIVPEMTVAMFQCKTCKTQIEKSLYNHRVQEPDQCQRCLQKNSFKLLHNHSIFVNMQKIKLQESVEEVREGETPLSLRLQCYDKMVNCVKPGDRVEISGILRTKGVRVIPTQRVISTVFSSYIDVVHFKKLTTKDTGESNLRQADQTRLQAIYRKMMSDPNLYENLARSIAPSLFGLNDLKKGMLCLLFGGANASGYEKADTAENDKNSANLVGRKQKTRGEINILLCGDPGVAKSQLLSFVHKVSPRGIYTSGKGSSAVGLTAYVTKDPETRETVLESGALVLSDKGICCIDEFDKMSDSTRAILHEVMEQQTISVAKAGIITSLNARTSILASANPIQSKYNPRLSVVHNLNLPPTLLSRFDLIFLVLDKVDESTDRQLAKHIVQHFAGIAVTESEDKPLKIILDNFYSSQPIILNQTRNIYYSRDLLSGYVKFCKENCSPLITSEAKHELIEQYILLRKKGNEYGSNNAGRKTISATTRQLESLIRLSESLCKMHCRTNVSRQDVLEAVRLIQEATQKAAVDPRTGVIDMDAINTGVGFADRKEIDNLAIEIEKLLAANVSKEYSVFEVTRFFRNSIKKSVSQAEVKQAVDMLRTENKITVNQHSQKIYIQ